jgi:hypothetical protein
MQTVAKQSIRRAAFGFAKRKDKEDIFAVRVAKSLQKNRSFFFC